MGKFIVLALIAYANSILAETPNPGVWEQLENGGDRYSMAVIESVEPVGDNLYVKMLGEDQTVRVCPTLPDNASLEMRTAILTTNIALLNQARENSKPIKYRMKGPWNPCALFTLLGAQIRH